MLLQLCAIRIQNHNPSSNLVWWEVEQQCLPNVLVLSINRAKKIASLAVELAALLTNEWNEVEKTMPGYSMWGFNYGYGSYSDSDKIPWQYMKIRKFKNR